jgi:hypothetical protein
MIWLLGGYMWLFVHRPFEYWPILGILQVERIYMCFMALVWLASPGKGLLPNRIHAAFVFLTVAMGAAWVVSPYADYGVDTIENYFKVAVFYLMVVTTVRDEDSLRKLVGLYVAAVGLYMAHSLWEFHNGRVQWRMGISRMIGVDQTFNEPNMFASTLVYSLPMTLPFWACRPGKLLRLLLVGYTAMACLCVSLTGSRAGMVGLWACAGLLVFVTARRKVRAVLWGSAAAAAALAVAAVAMPGELQGRYLTLFDSSYGPENAKQSASGRVAGFVAGLEAWGRSPLLGHGPESYGLATGRKGGAHNLYGQVLCDLGLLGAAALAGLLYCFGRNGAEARRLCPPEARRGNLAFWVSRAVGINAVLLALLGWSGHNLYRYNWLWYAAFGASALHCLRQKAAATAWHAPRWAAGAGVRPVWRGA